MGCSTTELRARIKEVLYDGESGDLDVIPATRKAVDEMDDVGPAPKFRWLALQRWQQNYIGKLFSSKSDTLRSYASRVIEGGILTDKKATRAFTAEGRGNNILQTFKTRMFRESGEHFKAWSKENDYGTITREVGIEANEKFYTEVGLAMQGNTDARVSSHAKAAAAKINQQMKEMHAMARDAGLPGFDAEGLENFLPRTWRQKGITELRDAVHDTEIAGWFANALKKHFVKNGGELDDLSDALFLRVGKGFTKALVRQNKGMDDMLLHGIPSDSVERLDELFDGMDIDLDTKNELIARLSNSSAQADGGRVRHGKARLRIDETHSATVKTKDGGEMELTLDVMTNTDAGKVVPRYFQVMSGWIGLAKEAGIRSNADVEAISLKMLDEGATTQEVTKFKETIKLVTGQSIEADPFSGTSQLSKVALGYGYVRSGGSFGVAQIPEMGNIMAEVGVVNFLKNLPEFRKLVARAENGDLESVLGRELEDLVAAGTDWINGGSRSNFDDVGLEFTHDSLRKIDSLLQRGGRLTQAMSLMAPINTFLERMATYDIAQNWGQFARKGLKNVSEAKKARLREAGLSDDMQEKIFEQLREHAEFDGDKLISLKMDDWTDLDAMDAYRMGLDRTRRYVIQRNDIGNTGAYIHKPLGRILTQFQSFMLNSINKQLLRNVHHNDIQTWVQFTTTVFIGSLAYTAQTSIDFANDDEERKKRLTPKRIAASAFQRSGWTAILPMVVDSAAAAGGYDQPFQYGRTSGLASNVIGGNSAASAVKGIYGVTTGVIKSLLHDDYRFSQADFRHGRKLVPGQRILGVANGFKAIQDALGLPETSTSQ